MRKGSNLNPVENNPDAKPDLPALYYFSFTLHFISFIMGLCVLAFLGYKFFGIFDGGNRLLSNWQSLFFTKQNFDLAVICFCGFLLERPTSWLVRLAENPVNFFYVKQEFGLVYRPLFWICYWLILIFTIKLSVSSLQQRYPIYKTVDEVIKSNSWIIISAFSVSILCIFLIEHYKKLMMVHKQD